MIPDPCPGRATRGEKLLYDLLKKLLPPDFTVWYEPDIGTWRPDFIVLGSEFGLLILETKDWRINTIARADNEKVELRLAEGGIERTKNVNNPLSQARRYMFEVKDQLESEPILREHGGRHKGNVCFPYACAVVFANISQGQLEQTDLRKLFPPEAAICSDELDEQRRGASQVSLVQSLQRFFVHGFHFAPLSPDQQNTIHGILHKEVIIRATPATPTSFPALPEIPGDARVFRVLDREQEQVARFLGEGHRIVAGVAGSGKTAILLARAKSLAMRDPGKAILFLCYNRTLATYLKGQLGNDPQYRKIQVETFMSWAKAQTGISQNDAVGERLKEFEQRLGRAMFEAIASWPADRKHDAILVDEGMDFDPEWFRAVVNAVKNGSDGDLLIAVDGAQSLYGRSRSFTWKSLGINARGRTQTFTRSYRSTREIIEFAWTVTQPHLHHRATSETQPRIVPTHARVGGVKPAWRACHSTEEETKFICALVRRFKQEGVREEDICVLYPRNEGRRIEDLFRGLEASGQVCWITNRANRSMRFDFTDRPGIRLSTIHSSKGIEFPVVVLCALDQLPHVSTADEDADLNLLYVGLTRAQNRLVITWTGSSNFTKHVTCSSKAAPFPKMGGK